MHDLVMVPYTVAACTHVRLLLAHTYGCSLHTPTVAACMHLRLQPACTYGCSLHHLRLQAIGKLFEKTMMLKYGPENVKEHFAAFDTICDATQACAWIVRGLCVAVAWRVHGLCMACAWHVLDVCSACARRVRGVCMACAWCAFRRGLQRGCNPKCPACSLRFWCACRCGRTPCSR